MQNKHLQIKVLILSFLLHHGLASQNPVIRISILLIHLPGYLIIKSTCSPPMIYLLPRVKEEWAGFVWKIIMYSLQIT